MPELEAGELIVGSNDVNSQGDYTLPAVVICDKSPNGEAKNLPRETVRKLDKKFSTGYILICNYLEFWGDDYDDATPNKKAVVTCSFLGLNHLLDIAREKGLLYIGADKLGLEIDCGAVQIKTGEMLRIVSDGARGLLYRVKQ